MTATKKPGQKALGRGELVSRGRTLVTTRLERVGCTVKPPTKRGEPFSVRTPSALALEMYVSTQRVGGYVFWPKRRFTPAINLLAAVVLLVDAPEPDLYLIPSTEWLDAKPPFTDRDNIGKRSEPEYGISVARSSLPALEPFLWTESAANRILR